MSIVFFPALQRRWFPPWRRYARAKAAFSDWVNRYVMEYLIQGRETNDVVGHILNSREKTDHFQNDSYIRDAIYSFLGPGHQTTATGLAWALYELGRHPSALDKLRTELATLGTEPDLDLLLTLPYLSAICNETLRLHPIIAECARVPVAPMEVLGRAIPADLGLVISIVGIHHDAMLYPEPGQFMPERFIERTYSPFEFLPFGGGHRRCMGAGLAEYIMRIALAEIVSSWDFETAATDWDVRKSLTFGPKHGVLLRIKARRKLKDNK